MPRKALHDAFEHALLGKVTGMTEMMDTPSVWLKGHHQSVMHSPEEIAVLAMTVGGDPVENFIAGMLHLSLDNIVKENKVKGEPNDRKRNKSGRTGRH